MHAVSRTALVLTLWTGWVSCTTVKFISDYDEPTDRGVTALQQKTSALFDKLQTSDPTPAYDTVSDQYDAIRRDLGSLILRNSARDLNDKTNGQLDSLKAALDRFESLHKQNRTLHLAVIAPARDQIDIIVRAILTLELKKKSA